MGWETVGNYKYFRIYRGVKDGKAVTVYMGRGPEAVAESNKLAARWGNIQAHRAMLHQDKLLDLEVKAFEARIHAEVAAALEPKGYHRIGTQWKIKGQGRRSPKV